MANIQKLIEKEQRERELAERHKKEADRLKKEIEYQRNQEVQKTLNKLNLTSDQFDKFIHVLNDKDSLFEAIELIAGDNNLKTSRMSLDNAGGGMTNEEIYREEQ